MCKVMVVKSDGHIMIDKLYLVLRKVKAQCIISYNNILDTFDKL